MTDFEKKLFEKNGLIEKAYGKRVNQLIREKYNIEDEIAILRQRDEKTDEFAAYNAFVEECKEIVRQEVYGDI